jgi:hypothetical protein
VGYLMSLGWESSWMFYVGVMSDVDVEISW